MPLTAIKIRSSTISIQTTFATVVANSDFYQKLPYRVKTITRLITLPVHFSGKFYPCLKVCFLRLLAPFGWRSLFFRPIVEEKKEKPPSQRLE